MPRVDRSLTWMIKSSRVMTRGNDCEGVTTVSVNDKKNMIMAMVDDLLRGQPYSCGSEY